jgi:O-antigen/teichoic acid export membrane protein
VIRGVLARAGATARGTQTIRRLGWGVGDQAVSSLSNFALGIVIARSLGPAEFGGFSLAYVTYALVLNASRGLATDPLVVRHSGAVDRGTVDRGKGAAAASATGTAASVGLVAGVICVLVGLALPDTIGPAFVALGVALPFLMLQDAWRFVFFAAGTPVKALLNDLFWGVLLLSGVLALHAAGALDVTTAVLAFGATGAAAAGLGLFQSGVAPAPRAVVRWLRTHRDLGSRYLAENLSVGLARQIRMTTLGAVAGLAAVGEVRAAELLMGPFLVILMGLSQVAVPEATQVVRARPDRLGAFCLVIGGAQASAAALWGIAVLVLLPFGLGELLLADLWRPASVLLPIVVVGMVAGGLEVGAATGVRALGAARRSLSAQLVTSGLYVGGGTVGAIVDGARGSCIGVTAGTAVATVVWWIQLRRAIDDRLSGRVPTWAGERIEEGTSA